MVTGCGACGGVGGRVGVFVAGVSYIFRCVVFYTFKMLVLALLKLIFTNNVFYYTDTDY